MHLQNQQFHGLDKRIRSVHLKHKNLDKALINVSVVSTSGARVGATFLKVRVMVKILKTAVSSKNVEAPHPKLVQNLM